MTHLAKRFGIGALVALVSLVTAGCAAAPVRPAPKPAMAPPSPPPPPAAPAPPVPPSPEAIATASAPQLVVFGSVHEFQETFTADMMRAVLDRVQPEAVFVELPVDWFSGDAPTPGTLKIIEDDGELRLLWEWSQKRGARFLPFDIGGRNQFYRDNDYFKRSDALFNGLIDAVSKKHPLLLDGMRRHFASKALCKDAGPVVMNSPLCDAVVETEHGFRRAVRLELLAIGQLKQLPDTDFWQVVDDEWDRRNRTMADNLCRLVRQSGKTRHLALVGFEHGYMLRPLLKESCPQVELREVPAT